MIPDHRSSVADATYQKFRESYLENDLGGMLKNYYELKALADERNPRARHYADSDEMDAFIDGYVKQNTTSPQRTAGFLEELTDALQELYGTSLTTTQQTRFVIDAYYAVEAIGVASVYQHLRHSGVDQDHLLARMYREGIIDDAQLESTIHELKTEGVDTSYDKIMGYPVTCMEFIKLARKEDLPVSMREPYDSHKAACKSCALWEQAAPILNEVLMDWFSQNH
ncbi:MAG: hypothetical protein ACQESG_01760 [Nanobdellota archaeon]